MKKLHEFRKKILQRLGLFIKIKRYLSNYPFTNSVHNNLIHYESQ